MSKSQNGYQQEVHRLWEWYGLMKELDNRSIIQLATKYTDPDELFKAIVSISGDFSEHEKGIIYEKIGIALYQSSFINHALNLWLHALRIAEEIGDSVLESRCYVNLGNAYVSLGEYTRAIEYTEKALEIAKEIGDKEDESRCYVN